MATIRSRGHLIVAVRDHWRPLGFRDDNGELVGLEIDLARQLAQRIFDNPDAVVLEVVSNQDRLPAVLEDRVDLAIAGLTQTPARMRLVSFSLPYYLDGAGFLVPADHSATLQTLAGGRIGLLQGSSTLAAVRYLLPQAHLVPLASYRAGQGALSQGQIDAFAGDVSTLVGWQQEQTGYRILPTLITADPLAIALPHGTQFNDLRQVVNQSLRDWHQSGWLEERTTLWGLP
ncbi:MAG: transporter substrate-binding domain-containing protein [Leptolyngbya sp.]|nr:transporter substrate-binding domain-containing protein [Leptolyngbya sp.]